MAKTIIEVTATKERYCNTCAKRTDNMQPTNEIKLGCNNSAMAIVLCDDCLKRFGDILWTYMDENNL